MDTDQNTAITEPEAHSAGSILRRCREFNRISLEEAAEATKIGKNYLRALEENRPQDLPSPAYLKGFLRTYAAYLGLQAEELLQLAAQQPGTAHAEPLKSDQVVQTLGGFHWQRLVLPAVLLTAVIVSAVFMVPSTPERPKPPAPQPASAVPQPAIPAAAVQPVRSSTVAATANTAAPQDAATEPALEPVAAPKARDGFMVRMKVNRNSSLSVIIDDAASQGYELTSGDLIEWKAARTIALDLSDAGSVDIELNGTPLKLQATPGKPAYVVLDANGLHR
ncbi:helix-turn-helix domain-containing protein [Trichlorobacter lovleyi]|uniref:Transcriptional regulator, putative n=1 Tax=Trichlorobacter lovleyi (strain ATCC BAA-1151 / DSM 17278 / SZ) TaxID=398767 RepID=B3E3N3_TRIL1|nr:helix-turn-helix domain-containing protein [Trichlorobacter lovleyi]ACD97305.1 transcriptional regulator, putative [Trichlorobacter lovleyi SZ]